MKANWTTANENGDEVVRHYPFTTEGFMIACAHANLNGLAVWQSFDGEPRYLMEHAPRQN